MRLKRPHIPLDVRLQVAARQLIALDKLALVLTVMGTNLNREDKLAWMLSQMFGSGPIHLDHDPPLVLRPYSEATGKYTPDANDPRHLVYRTKEGHRIKTFVRGDGAQLSDAAKRRKEIKRRRKENQRIRETEAALERHLGPLRKPRWPKGRKIPSRPMR